ncbi:hypothetical protein BGZ73_006977 [Actinomortierella ambigua]|nr:hypothetical protein BGZ73_006977 [Actinomortierella ambigua]
MASAAAPPNLLQFKAGQCFRVGGTKTVRPDPTKGLVYMAEEDGLLHLYWKNRTTNTVDDDLILFPGDAEIVTVPQCTTGRVIMLQFKSSSQKLFYWLQEANTDRDHIIVAQANSLINQGMEDTGFDDDDVTMEEADDHDNPATSTSIAASTSFAPAAPVAPAQTNVNPTNPTSTTTAPASTLGSQPGASSLSASQMDQLRHLLSGIQVPQSSLRPQRSNLRLDHILTPGAVDPLLQNEQHLTTLLPHLPDELPHTADELQAVIRSPQFRQALVSLSSALDSGQLGPLLRQFGLGPRAGEGVDGFLHEIEEQAKREKQQGPQ